MFISRIHGQKTKFQEGILLVDIVERDLHTILLVEDAIHVQCRMVYLEEKNAVSSPLFFIKKK